MMRPLHCYGNERSCSSRLGLAVGVVTVGSLGNVSQLKDSGQMQECVL